MPDPTGRVSHVHEAHRGFSWKPAARMASTANLTLSGLQTIDGVVGASDDIVFVKDQTAGAGNGLYWMRSGAWVRHASMDQDGASSVPAEEVMGAYVAVIAGTVNGGTLWRNTNTTAPTLGTTALTFAQMSGPLTISDEGYVLSPAPTYAAAVLATSPVAYWRLGEASGTVAAAEVGPAGTYTLGPVLGAAGALAGDPNTGVSFDGVDDHVVVPDFAAASLITTGALSIGFWVKPSQIATYRGVVGKAGVPYEWAVYVGSGVQVWVWDASGTDRIELSTATLPALAIGAWAHVFATMVNGTSVDIYVNGVLAASTLSAWAGVSTDTASNVYIGQRGDLNNGFFLGTIDEPAIWNRALSAAEIANLYAVGTTVRVGSDTTSIDFVGAGVVVTGTGAAKTVRVAGASGGNSQLASIAAASAAIANTETVVASASLAANYLTAGMSFRIRAAGVGSTGLTPGVDTFRVRIGTTTLLGTIPTSVAPAANASVTAQAFSFEALLTVRTTGAAGSIIGECLAVGDDIATGLFTTLVDLSATVATVAVDTTATKLLELTFQSATAGSSCTFHVATIEVLSSGAAGAAAGGLVLLAQQTASASASLDFTTAITATYDDYMIEVLNVLPATAGADLLVRCSTDGGSTYDAGANYDSRSSYVYNAGSGVGGGGAAQNAMTIGPTLATTAAGGGTSGWLRFMNPGSTATYKRLMGQTLGWDNNVSGPLLNNMMGVYRSTTAVNAISFMFSSGNIASGTIRVYGLQK